MFTYLLSQVVIKGGRSNYFDGLGSNDYFSESNRYFLPVTLDPITFQFHCDMGWASASPSILRQCCWLWLLHVQLVVHAAYLAT